MPLSSGAKGAAGLAAGWLAALLVAGALRAYWGEIADAARLAVVWRAEKAPEGAEEREARYERTPKRSAHGETRAEIRAGARGHYYTKAEVNGREIDVVIDSGASRVALTFDDARHAGIYVGDRDFSERVSTANGIARVAPVTLSRVSIGDVSVRDVTATVSEPGSLATSLLGMSFLNRLQRVDMRSGVLVLVE